MIKPLTLRVVRPHSKPGPGFNELLPDELSTCGEEIVWIRLSEVAKIERVINMLIEEHNEILEAGMPAGLAIEREWKDPNQETE